MSFFYNTEYRSYDMITSKRQMEETALKTLDQKAYQEVRTWMHRNARELELALWKFHFEGGSREEVVQALACYQNEDGGFSSTIEPDIWNPESAPYSAVVVTGILRGIGFLDNEGAAHPVVQGILRYLDSGVHSDETGWHFSVPSNDLYAHAPWWSYSEESNRVQDLGLTATLCAFVLGYAGRDSALFQKAAGYTKQILEKVSDTEDLGEMGAGGVLALLGEIMRTGLADSFECGSLMEKMAVAVNQRIERNPEKWAGYTPRPSEFIPSTESPFYKGNEEIVEKELDYLVETRNPGGVWNITWNWFNLGEKYAKEFAISENWWMGVKAIDTMLFLRNFGRISAPV